MENYIYRSFYEESSFSSEKPFFFQKLKTDMGSNTVPPHFHRFMEFVSFQKGKGGTVYLDDMEYPYETGDLVLIKPYALHAYHFNSEHQPFILLGLDMFSLLDIFAHSLFYDKLNCNLQRISLSHPIQKEHGNSLVSLMGKINKTGFVEKISQLLLFLSSINPVQYQVEEVTDNGSEYLQRYIDAVAYIERNYSQPLTLSDVAEHVGMSPQYMSTTFKNRYNFRFKDHLHKVRISKGKNLLLYTDKSVSEIAYALCYTDASYFIKIFKQYVGCSPIQFREKSYSVTWLPSI